MVFHLHVHDLTAKAVIVFDKTGKRIAPIAVPESWTFNVSFDGKVYRALGQVALPPCRATASTRLRTRIFSQMFLTSVRTVSRPMPNWSLISLSR